MKPANLLARLKPFVGRVRIYNAAEWTRRRWVLMKTIKAAAVATALWAHRVRGGLGRHRSRAIQRQFEAFARDDARAAYVLADPTIKQMFVDADHFLAMVRDAIPRSTDIAARVALRGIRDDASLKATLVDAYSVVSTALYSFRREENGDWLISG